MRETLELLCSESTVYTYKHGIVARMLVLAGKISLSCNLVSCVTTLWVKHRLSVSQLQQLSLPSLLGQ